MKNAIDILIMKINTKNICNTIYYENTFKILEFIYDFFRIYYKLCIN